MLSLVWKAVRAACNLAGVLSTRPRYSQHASILAFAAIGFQLEHIVVVQPLPSCQIRVYPGSPYEYQSPSYACHAFVQHVY